MEKRPSDAKTHGEMAGGPENRFLGGFRGLSPLSELQCWKSGKKKKAIDKFKIIEYSKALNIQTY
jgi:hypothetical protein